MKRNSAIAIGAVLLIVAAVLSYLLMRRPKQLAYSGTVETREIQVGSKVGGRVTEVGAEEGQVVKASAVLVRFEADELKAQRAQAEAAVEQAEADLQKMKRGYRPEEIAQAKATELAQQAQYELAKHGPRSQEVLQARANYDAAQADAMNAETNFKRMQMLIRGETISRQQYDDAIARRDAAVQRAESALQGLKLLEAGTREEDMKAAEQRYLQAKAAAELMERGYRREDIETARGQLKQAKAHVAELDARLRETELLAPTDGLVETVSVRAGDLVSPGRIVLTMLESSQLWVRIYIPETEMAEVKIGQKATVTVDSFRGRTFAGHLAQINSSSEFLPRNVQTRDDREHQVFGAKVMVDNASGVLKSGMAATVLLQ